MPETTTKQSSADPRPTAWILTVGGELLAGDILDTNAREISQSLQDAGLLVTRRLTLPDDVAAIAEAVSAALAQCDLAVVTGGLGPTPDDVTRDGVALAFGVGCTLREELRPALEGRYRSYTSRPMPEQNLLQITLPEGADPIPNPLGTAPGFRMDRARCAVFVVPGIPREMRGMLADSVLPWIAAHRGALPLGVRVLRTMGIGESDLIQQHGEFLSGLPGVTVAYYPQQPGEDIKLVALGPDASGCLARAEAAILERLGALVYATGSASLPRAVGELLVRRGATVAVAESCTGGALAHALISEPGASRYVLSGVVAYADAAKVELLDVPKELIERHGAVSEPVARAMAEGLRRRSGADYVLSTTGIAGPDGGTQEKPVGLVHSAIAGPEGTHAFRSVYPGTREMVVRRSVWTDLNRFRLMLRDAG